MNRTSIHAARQSRKSQMRSFEVLSSVILGRIGDGTRPGAVVREECPKDLVDYSHPM